MKLSDAKLAGLPDDVVRPNYDRSKLTPGIIHIGLGNFHRAHQAWYLQQLMQKGKAKDWAIVGAGVRSNDECQRQKLAAQDYLTTLIELDPSGQSVEVVGSMIDFVPVQPNNATLVARMADPAIRIVSLTVTESGYYVDPAGQKFDSDHPDIQHDIANPSESRTAFGAIVAALKQRRAAGIGPFTCQSCDNLQGNGDVLHHTVISLAKLIDEDLANWIDQNCTFPNSMVDCIVPATGVNELALVQKLSIEDAAPVTHENFRQWVIEDRFCASRPDWDLVGATFTDAVHAYEKMKIRILNGGHQIVSNAGEILSVDTISGCMAEPLIRALFEKVASEEIALQVNPVPDMTPQDYVKLIERRFSNPDIVDTVRRVAFDGSSRHPGFLMPIMHEALENGDPVDGLALTEALWARMCEGTREDGSSIEPNDPKWSELTRVANAAKSDPQIWISQSEFYGDLAQNQRFSDGFERWLDMIWQRGTRATLQFYLEG